MYVLAWITFLLLDFFDIVAWKPSNFPVVFAFPPTTIIFCRQLLNAHASENYQLTVVTIDQLKPLQSQNNLIEWTKKLACAYCKSYNLTNISSCMKHDVSVLIALFCKRTTTNEPHYNSSRLVACSLKPACRFLLVPAYVLQMRISP